MEIPDLLIAGREAFASQDWAGTVAALRMAGPLPPDASEPCAERGWISLAEAERTHDPAEAIAHAEAALGAARAFR